MTVAADGMTPAPTASDDGVDIRLLVDVLRRRWKAIAACVALAIGLAVIYALIRAPLWQAQARLVAHSAGSQNTSQLAGLATQFGIRLPVDAGVATSPELYIELLGSMDLLRRAAATTYTVTQDDGTEISGTLMDILDVAEPDPEVRIRDAAGTLQRQMTTRYDRLSSTIMLGVQASSSDLAVQLANRLVELLNESMLDLRQQRVEDEAEFVSSRMNVAFDALVSAEDTLSSFMARNRAMGLDQQIQASRLEQTAELRRQVYLSLAQSFEQAKIDQIRDMPLLSVIEHPEFTVRRAGASGKVLVVVGAMLGVLTGITVAILLESRARLRRRSQPV